MSACLNCGGNQVRVFHSIREVPSHSCLLMDTAEQARTFPRAPIDLGFCPDCGFIANTIYDESLQAYSTDYEETQHFSGHFTSFAKKLAQQWIGLFGIRNQHVLEIGCGKGEFLQLMCEQGDNRGTGIDPACIPDRLSAEARRRITFIREYYGPHHAELKADVILCRHTLEHIPQTLTFLSKVRGTLNEDTLLLFELPDMKRVLRECAFWDIYYEHCSYFTAGSLAKVFRKCELDVVQLERAYDEQYLILAARPSRGVPNLLPLEDELQETVAEVEAFESRIASEQNRWRDRVTDLAQQGSVIAWGAGSKCVAFATTLGIEDELDYVIDINPHKQGKYLPGTAHAVFGPEHVRNSPPSAVVIMNPVYKEEIRQQLQANGCSPELLCLGAD